MGLLSDKIIILTGGSMGIGFECAKKYAEAGAIVIVLSNDSVSLADAMKELGMKHHGILCDVSVGEEVAMAIEETLQRFGRIDVIHNNAGIAAPSKPLHLTEEEEWNRLFDVNVKSIYLTTKYGLDALKLTQGCILNTSSLVADIGQENHAAYTATKGAVNSLTKSMALDYARFNIRVNALAPAAVWTPLLREWNSEQDNESMEEYLAQIHPLGYCPEGDVIADAGVFLLSDKARFITGCILPVSGGAELGYRRLHH
jgi:NAD(P)-dependent dehydrogenase (short-subunit alcohol dehydrogenase family)